MLVLKELMGKQGVKNKTIIGLKLLAIIGGRSIKRC